MTIAIAQTAFVDSGTAIWGDSTHTGNYPNNPAIGNGKIVIAQPNRDRSLATASDADGSFTVLHSEAAPLATPNCGGGIAARIATSTTAAVTTTTNANTSAGNPEHVIMLEFSDIADPIAEVGTSDSHQEAVATNTHCSGQTFDPGGVTHYIIVRSIGFSANPGSFTPAAPPTGSWVSVPTGVSTRYSDYLIVEGNSDPVDMSFTTGGTARTSFTQWAAVAGVDSDGSTTITPGQGTMIFMGRLGTVNSFSSVAIREVLINEAGSPVANRTGMHLLVWYAGTPTGAPDLSLTALTTDAAGTASWSLPPSGLVYNQALFYLAHDGGASLSQYTCARMTPTYQ